MSPTAATQRQLDLSYKRNAPAHPEFTVLTRKEQSKRLYRPSPEGWAAARFGNEARGKSGLHGTRGAG